MLTAKNRLFSGCNPQKQVFLGIIIAKIISVRYRLTDAYPEYDFTGVTPENFTLFLALPAKIG